MFQDFSSKYFEIPAGVTIHARIGGEGPPVLLLHGYPETSACWNAVAPELISAGYSVVVPDLRGYGASSKPSSSKNHETYSKRVMATDQVQLMSLLGYDHFFLVGHDRGGRVAHRLALDYPDILDGIVVLDIVPTATMYNRTDKRFASAYYHWFFLIQPAPFPERLIGNDPDFFLQNLLGSLGRAGLSFFSGEAIEEYHKYFKDPACIAATCEDYRAAASIDLVHDEEDNHRLVSVPLLVLWGGNGVVGTLYDVISTWKEKASNVSGCTLSAGHFIPEESPKETARALISFFRKLAQ